MASIEGGGKTHRIAVQYLVGCDGAASAVRRALGIGLEEFSLLQIARRHAKAAKLALGALAGRAGGAGIAILLLHFRTKRPIPHLKGIWHTTLPNGTTIISQNDKDIFTAHIPLRGSAVRTTANAHQRLHSILGGHSEDMGECELLASDVWQPRLAVAETYQNRRVFLAGDSAHQLPPPGGYGMNTGIGDAFALAEKLAVQLRGKGDEDALARYSEQRRDIALRNIEKAGRHLVARLELMQAAPPENAPEHEWRKYARIIAGKGGGEYEDMGLGGFVPAHAPVFAVKKSSERA